MSESAGYLEISLHAKLETPREAVNRNGVRFTADLAIWEVGRNAVEREPRLRLSLYGQGMVAGFGSYYDRRPIPDDVPRPPQAWLDAAFALAAMDLSPQEVAA